MQIISRAEAKEQGLKHYFTGKACPNGHVAKRFVSSFGCSICTKEHYDKCRKESPEKYAEASRKSRRKNPEKHKEVVRKWQENNPEHKKRLKRAYHRRHIDRIREEHRARYRDNREELCAKQVEYRKNNRDKLNAYYRKYRPERAQKDPGFRMRMIASSMLRRVLLKTCQSKTNKTEKTLGYTSAQLRDHIERNMTKDMTWDNYGALWEIDHIIAVATMIKHGVIDPAKINALSNLMPEYKDANMAKGDRFALCPQPLL